MTTPARDRLADLLTLGTLSGIDFVEIADLSETTLVVHFLTSAIALQGTVTSVTITGGETIPSVAVQPFASSDWGNDALSGNTTLTLHVLSPGDFSTYTLTIESPLLDEYFARAPFSFKALCPTTIDCETPPVPCTAPPVDFPPIDYLAKDFLSFRQALSDFSSLRYPAWQERAEADFGVMFMEALCAIADDLSYQQDRVAAQACLDTVTERRSLVRLARLVDYEPAPATASRVILKFTVNGGPIPAGLLVSATTADGTVVDFETGTGLADLSSYDVRPEWNAIPPWWWDDSERCLPQGATSIWVDDPGHKLNLQKGQLLLIDTLPAVDGDPPIRQIVTIDAFTTDHDAVYDEDVARIDFGAPDALQQEHDLTRTTLSANLVPATQGRRCVETFAIDQAPRGTPLALVRTGPNQSVQYLHTLGQAPLAWLNPSDGTSGSPTPEILLDRLDAEEPWTWIRSLLDADLFASVFTLDPMRYAPVGGPDANGSVAMDYDGSDGTTVRFGDGTFGEVPASGATFEARYRVGGGSIGNLAADSITTIDPTSPLALTAVTNPFAATGGSDEEPDETVRRLAPQAFQAVQYRAVRPEDYAAAAETLDWVERAGTTFRYTGSWLTVFTSVDPRTTELPTDDETRAAVALLNRYRMVGYESYVLPPKYASLDLRIYVCAKPDAFRGDVETSVRQALSAGDTPNGPGFFRHDRFTFGQPLERSELEAAVQHAYGVDGVLDVRYRRRGVTAGFVEMPDEVRVAVDEIIRADGDPSRPDAGSVAVFVGGGK